MEHSINFCAYYKLENCNIFYKKIIIEIAVFGFNFNFLHFLKLATIFFKPTIFGKLGQQGSPISDRTLKLETTSIFGLPYFGGIWGVRGLGG